jgi:hypothetical protein
MMTLLPKPLRISVMRTKKMQEKKVQFLMKLLTARKKFLLKMMYPQFQMMPLLALMQATNHLTKTFQRTTKKMMKTFELS